MKLQSEILRAIRGKFTTSAFSAKLGYRFNQYARWEKGERRLSFTDFVAICHLRRLPIRQQFQLYLGFEGDLSDTAFLTKTMLNGRSIDDVSKITKLSRSKISRWLHGKASPTFSDVYILLRSGVNTISFLEPLVDLEIVPSLANDYASFKQQRELAYTLPYLDALLEALIVRRYESLPKHDSKVLALVAGLPVEVVDRTLAALAEAGLVEKRAGKYKVIEIGIDYRSDKQRMAKILGHWLRETTDVVEKVVDKAIESSHVGFGVFSLSREGQEKATVLLREFVRAMHTIGSEAAGTKEKVFVFTASLVDTERFGQES